MNNKPVLVATAALMLLAACGGDAAETANAASPDGAGSAASSASAAGSPLTEETLIGTWGQSDCTNTMSFAADGTATSSSAEQANNRWSLDGSTIVITSPGEEDIRMPATLIDGELHLTGGGGEGASTVLARCETEEDAAAGDATGSADEAGEEGSE